MCKKSVVIVGCAWIMWGEQFGSIGYQKTWEPQSAFGTLEECEKALAKSGTEMKVVTEDGRDTGGVKFVPGVIKDPTGRGVLFSKCLPDTIDPRPRK